jgi:threonine synthase
VTVAAAGAARRRGVIRDGDEVVVLLTGNGLKTPEARLFGLPDGRDNGAARPGEPGLAPPIAPSFGAFERWLGGAV